MDAGDEVTIRYTITEERALTEDAGTLAKTLGVSLAKLRRIVAGDEEYEPSDAAKAHLARHSDIEDESFTVESIEEA